VLGATDQARATAGNEVVAIAEIGASSRRRAGHFRVYTRAADEVAPMLQWVPGSLRVLLAVVLLGLGAGRGSQAFTDPVAFAAAVPGGVTSVDFEALAGGTLVSGVTLTPPGAAAGIALPPPLADVLDPTGPPLQLQVVADSGDNPASSGTRSLGVQDPGNFNAFAAGGALAFQFSAPVQAFGLTLVTPEEPNGALFDGDVQLFAPGTATAILALADGSLLGTFGGREYRAYFLGVVATTPFTSASLAFGGTTPASGFFYNVDDLVVPVPEPALPPSLLAGVALLAGLRRLGTGPPTRRRSTRRREAPCP
jgi:hypothetical protein